MFHEVTDNLVFLNIYDFLSEELLEKFWQIDIIVAIF